MTPMAERTILVTGATDGLGRALAGELAAEGATVLVHGYSGVRAYCQSKLAQILFTFDLADELSDAGVTASALHPATYMPTKMVTHAGATPMSELAEGVVATRRLVSDPALEGVSGRYFSGLNEARADEQAYDPEARRRLRELSDELVAQWA